jgi:hypothetical protein
LEADEADLDCVLPQILNESVSRGMQFAQER